MRLLPAMLRRGYIGMFFLNNGKLVFVVDYDPRCCGELREC